MSFKHGSGERVFGGRRFTDLTEEKISTALTGTGLALEEVWVSGDVRAGRSGERWLNTVARRAGQS